MSLTPAERVQVQSLILSDATPFDGADIAAILADVAGLAGATMRGTDNAELEADALDRYTTLRQKATAPAWNQDTDSLEAIREVCDSIVTNMS